jgi:phenylalanyl-tRNA synthetase beta chain
MKCSKRWLEEWINVTMPSNVMAEQLTMIGLEVDAVSPVAPEFTGVVVGKVISVEPHPNADKLKVCQVDIGADTPVTVVCGAPNVREDTKFPIALMGANLPGGAIKKSKLRGVVSEGMLCSEKELGLSDEHISRLMELPDDLPVGQTLHEALQLEDEIIEVALTANRGDCASVRGVARDLAAFNRSEFLEPEPPTVDPVIDTIFPITVTAAEACPHYVGRVIRSVNLWAKTPLWMRERLRRSGMRNVHPVVDVMNYVMLELGQPLHAFDLDKLSESLEVRFAKPKEPIELLTGDHIELDTNTLVIADTKGPVAVAGIIGGHRAAVSDTTQTLFLESAFFDVLSIAGRARQYGLQTDAVYRFERGVDPELQVYAIERATQLLLEIVGGRAGPIIEIREPQHMPKREAIEFNPGSVQRILGLSLSAEESLDILSRLGMKVEQNLPDKWKVVSPSHRFGIEIEENLVAEIGRIHGYEEIPMTPLKTTLTISPRYESKYRIRRLRYLLQDRGFHEVITYSFIDPTFQAIFEPDSRVLALSNPVSKDLSVMRTSLWPNLVKTFLFNVKHQQQRIRLFEWGSRFHYVKNQFVEDSVISGLVSGPVHSEQWGISDKRSVDFFDVKKEVMALFQLVGLQNTVTFHETPKHPSLHTARNAAIVLEDLCVGYMGELHPRIVQAYDITDPVYLFELALKPLLKDYPMVCQRISKFPSVRRDLALLMDKNISLKTVEESIRAIAGNLLVDFIVFDVYQGEQIQTNQKSIALGLVFQHEERTLQVTEIEVIVEQIMDDLSKKLGIQLRT